MWVLGAGTAHALTVTAPADATAAVDVRVDLEARDGSGTVLLVKDGLVVGEQPTGGLWRATHGCIRMCNRDVLGLWPQVPLGTMVITRQ